MNIPYATKIGAGGGSCCPECGYSLGNVVVQDNSGNECCANCKLHYKPIPFWMTLFIDLAPEVKEQFIKVLNNPTTKWLTKDGVEFQRGMTLYKFDSDRGKWSSVNTNVLVANGMLYEIDSYPEGGFYLKLISNINTLHSTPESAIKEELAAIDQEILSKKTSNIEAIEELNHDYQEEVARELAWQKRENERLQNKRKTVAAMLDIT